MKFRNASKFFLHACMHACTRAWVYHRTCIVTDTRNASQDRSWRGCGSWGQDCTAAQVIPRRTGPTRTARPFRSRSIQHRARKGRIMARACNQVARPGTQLCRLSPSKDNHPSKAIVMGRLVVGWELMSKVPAEVPNLKEGLRLED